jgi:hypothetical protein
MKLTEWFPLVSTKAVPLVLLPLEQPKAAAKKINADRSWRVRPVPIFFIASAP